ncbi:uncharacterized protein LOC121870249 [Homarus americanus]|uniref:uncharacterized protein LOC121870249 n=1 Tax=Homarus americanus TaxID=6706 RepID=UPI001C44CF77|nr:uncharacterized protein LOC121870249 [Homarus americanus]
MDAMERQKVALAFSTTAGLAQLSAWLKALTDNPNSLHPDSAYGVYEALSTFASGFASAFNLCPPFWMERFLALWLAMDPSAYSQDNQTTQDEAICFKMDSTASVFLPQQGPFTIHPSKDRLLQKTFFLVALAMGFRSSQLKALTRFDHWTSFAQEDSAVSLAPSPTYLAWKLEAPSFIPDPQPGPRPRSSAPTLIPEPQPGPRPRSSAPTLIPEPHPWPSAPALSPSPQPRPLAQAFTPGSQPRPSFVAHSLALSPALIPALSLAFIPGPQSIGEHPDIHPGEQ